MKSRLLFITFFMLLFGIFSLSCQRDKTAVGPDNDALLSMYPAVFVPPSEAEILQLEQEFQEINSKVSWVNISFDGRFNAQIISPIDVDPATYSEQDVIQQAKKLVLKNKMFFHINSASDLTHARCYTTGNTVKVDFNQQVYGIQVYQTTIQVLFDPFGMCTLSGLFYPLVFTPKAGSFDRVRAENALIGYRHEYICWGPSEFIIEQKDISDPQELIIFPKYADDDVELRLVWHIPVWEGDHIMWDIYLDAITYELVAMKPRFIC